MNPRVLAERWKDSLFFIPTFYIFGAIGLAWLTNVLDSRVGPQGLTWLLQTSPSGARALLGTVAGATITVAGVVFSLTALTVQLSATQYSPRVLQGFLRDRFQQNSVGIVVGTFTFSLVALAMAGPAREQTVYAPWAATVATVAGLITVLTIVGFIDHVSRRIRVDDTIRRLSFSTTRSFAQALEESPPNTVQAVEPIEHEAPPHQITSTATGWVQHIDIAALTSALPAHSLMRVDVNLGRFVIVGEGLVTAWSGAEVEATEIRQAFAIGETRSIDQDPTFGIRLMVDIALRALSPGINDPTTAADVVRHMVEPLRASLFGESSPRVVIGTDGRRIYLPTALSMTDIVRLAYTEIRLAARGQLTVARALVDSIGVLVAMAGDSDMPARAELLLTQFRLLVGDLRKWDVAEEDLEWVWAVVRRHSVLLAHLDEAGEFA